METVKILCVIASLVGLSAHAQTTVWDSTKDLGRGPAAEGKEKQLGWSKKANIGANLSFSSSKDVVGQTDGTSQTYGTSIKSSFDHNSEQAEWRNTVEYNGATTKTPSLPRYVKSSDELKLGSIYLHSLENYPKIGPYARAEAAAPIFIGEDVRSENKTYQINRLNASASTTQTDSSIRLTDGFKPLSTKEAVGFFYKPIQEDRLKVETRAGFGAQQISARGQYAVSGVATNGDIKVSELDDVSQAGLELAFNVKGKLNEASSYEVGAESLTPFINNKRSGDDRDAIRLTNIEGFVKLSSNITSWATFGYDYKVKIQPQLVDRAQQIHMLVINMNYNLL
ncbi:MAG: hypothetical protein AB7F86_03205 [Bdellovibrionales bacterium]